MQEVDKSDNREATERETLLSFPDVDSEMLNFFLSMETIAEFIEFERWLIGANQP
jgi:hypothetical protein